MKFTVSGRGYNKEVLVELNRRDVKRGITPDNLYRLFAPVKVDVYKYTWGVKIPVRFVGQVELAKKIYSIGKEFGFSASNASDVERAQENCLFYLEELRELGYDCLELEKRISGLKYDKAYAVLSYHTMQIRNLISSLIVVTREDRTQEAMCELYKHAARYRDLAEGTNEPWAYERHIYEADTVISALAHAKTGENTFNSLDFASRMEYQSTLSECVLSELKSDVITWKNRVLLAEDYLASETKIEENVSHETCYADTDSVHTPEMVKLGAKWSRPVIEDAALNFGFSPETMREFIRLFEANFEVETGWSFDSDTAEACSYGDCVVKLIAFLTDVEKGNTLWDKCFDTAAEQLENRLGELDDEPQPTPEAEEATRSEFESFVYAAAEKLGVEI